MMYSQQQNKLYPPNPPKVFTSLFWATFDFSCSEFICIGIIINGYVISYVQLNSLQLK